MFPPSLQKNIRELDRQISLLETECESMESEKKDFSGKIIAKGFCREHNQTSGCINSIPVGSFSVKKFPVGSQQFHGADSTVPLQTVSRKLNVCKENEKSENDLEVKQSQTADAKQMEKNSGDENESTKTLVIYPKKNHPEKLSLEETKPKVVSCKVKNSCKRSISSVREVLESSDENSSVRKGIATRQSLSSKLYSKSPTWSDIFCKNSTSRCERKKRRSKKQGEEIVDEKIKYNLSVEKQSSSEETVKEASSVDKSQSPTENESEILMKQKKAKRRRTRSVGGRQNFSDDVGVDANISKAFIEKEIQCMLWNEEREKAVFLSNLNNSIRTLHLLIGELKTKSSQEKRNDVLNDMQNTLMKISGIKSINALNNPLGMMVNGNLKFLEGDENNVIELRKTLYGVKQFCQELSDEKSALSDELSTKNRLIVCMKNKEKEYLSLISSLKFNLEKIKEEAEEGSRAKRDLVAAGRKLIEEAKIIKALKTSHEKMQELIKNYALENDKLKTQIKIAKLESQKFNVLLAGKEIEIKKYKDEIESFQKQIVGQLRLLRSKVNGNEVEKTLKAISNQANFLSQTEIDSFLSETTLEIQEELDGSVILSAKTSNFTLNRTQPTPKEIKTRSEATHSVITSERKDKQKRAEMIRDSIEYYESQDDKNLRDGGFASCESETEETEKQVAEEEEEVEVEEHGQKMDEDKSENLRESIDKILHDMREECSRNLWTSSRDSIVTSQGTLVSSSSENLSRFEVDEDFR